MLGGPFDAALLFLVDFSRIKLEQEDAQLGVAGFQEPQS
jgi:hypothetical protein